MDVEEDIAWKIRNECGKYIREGRSIAAAVMPLVRKAQAEAHGEGYVSGWIHAKGTEMSEHEYRHPGNPYAVRNSEGNDDA